MLKSKFFLAFFTVTLILFSASIFQNPKNQGINWTFPYFSGAANFERLFDWRISPSDYDMAASLSDQKYREYKHRKTDDTIFSINNFYGYVLIALTSRTLFPRFGDLNGVILLQLLVHIIVSLFLILKVLDSQIQRYGFMFLYGANPLIIRFATFPLYFFWAFIPAAALVIIRFRPRWILSAVPLLTPLLLLSILIRPTTLFLCGFIYLSAWVASKSRRERTVVSLSAVFFSLIFILLLGQQTRSPWHTMYVGLGAYSNDYGAEELSDDVSYALLKDRTGISINTDPVRGNYNDPTIRKQFDNVVKSRYLEILRDHPLSLVRNAVLNVLQSFSVGYDPNSRWVTRASTALGGLMVGFLVVTGQRFWIAAVLAVSFGYVLYFPPIPAYHFGAYLLLVSGFLLGVERLLGWMLHGENNEGVVPHGGGSDSCNRCSLLQ